jgi:Uma2 family endonuclease
MPALVNDPDEVRRLRRARRAAGLDRHDEVWNGVYVMNAMPNNEHQRLVLRICYALETVIGEAGLGRVLPGANVSDRERGWKRNYRCPDVLVYLNDNPAQDRGEYWLGGPDFAVEVLSPRDRARKKLDFYAQVGTREVLLLDRAPWRLELYRTDAGRMTLVESVGLDEGGMVVPTTVPLTFSLHSDSGKPQVRMTHPPSGQRWVG